jgi:hypothetical protein
MIRVFGLRRGGAPKYAQGVLLMGEQRLSNRGVGLRLRPAAQAASATRLIPQAVAA